ncbi:siphovirus Gp157 family protein [Limosilactobacillus fermentum]|uniref:siphovirus Gp157 family protein n=1 Tax=Limosilactobacillus fermentum TaxID=1613 RepID=UPI000583C1E7|nr:siphovirus Gp157 family protein [Limosilactobacillus fermentum]CDI69262.1 Gp157 family protein [Limosilactobacillus fermentum L930BB]
MKLYELSEAYRELLDRDDLDPQAVVDTLDAIKDEIEIKADNIASLIDELQSSAERKKEKAKAWSESARADVQRAKWLKQYLTSELDNAKLKKVETENHLLNVRNFKASTVIDDEDKIPDQYRNYAKYEGMYDVMKQDVYAALKDGKDVPGAHLEPNRNVVIK